MTTLSSLTRQSALRSLSAALCITALVGCGQSKPAEEYPTPGAAVAKVEQLVGEIRADFEAGTPKKAHDAMHAIGKLLLKIEKPGFLEQLDAGARDEMKEAAKALFDVYTKIDGAMFHGGDASQAPEYSELAPDIDAALATLLKHVPEADRQAAAEELTAEDHDHDHRDHDHEDHDGHDHGSDEHGDHDHDHDHDHDGHDHDEAEHANESAGHDEDAHDHNGHDHDDTEHANEGEGHDDDHAHEAEPAAEEPVAEEPEN